MVPMPSPEANRVHYAQLLVQLESDLLRMGQTVMEMIELASEAALNDQPELAARVLELELDVDQMHADLLYRVMVTLAMESPVAQDLRLLAGTFAMLGELEKVGDEATKLARRLQKLAGGLPVELHELFREISTQSQANVRDALRLYNQYSHEAAERLIEQDDVVDRTYKTSRNVILARMREEPDNLRQLLRCAEVFHALEHVSDHTVDMAKSLRGCFERYSKPVENAP